MELLHNFISVDAMSPTLRNCICSWENKHHQHVGPEAHLSTDTMCQRKSNHSFVIFPMFLSLLKLTQILLGTLGFPYNLSLYKTSYKCPLLKSIAFSILSYSFEITPSDPAYTGQLNMTVCPRLLHPDGVTRSLRMK